MENKMSRRPDAKTVKISENALNQLKHVKEDILKEASYSQSILIMNQDIERSNKNKTIDFGEASDDAAKDKTIVLSREAHVLLNNLKYERDLKTISAAIEYLCTLWLEVR